MYCVNCGKMLDAEATFCSNCGACISEAKKVNVSDKQNRFIGFILSFFIPIAGLIVSIIELNKAKEEGSTTSFAIVGIVISAVSMFISLIITIIFLPLFIYLIAYFSSYNFVQLFTPLLFI